MVKSLVTLETKWIYTITHKKEFNISYKYALLSGKSLFKYLMSKRWYA
jgi:hypothetical protein